MSEANEYTRNRQFSEGKLERIGNLFPMNCQRQFRSIFMMRTAQFLFLALAIFLLVLGSAFGGYAHSKLINASICYSCMSLEAKKITIKFEDFSTREVAHPQWVREKLKEKVVFIFVWANWCTSCKAQWNDMEDADIVSGDEETGSINSKYAADVELYSVDYDSDSRINEIIQAYHPNPQNPAIPLTVMITLVNVNETVKIAWYAFEGYSVEVENLKDIIESAVLYHNLYKSQYPI